MAHAACAGRRGCDGATGRYNTLPLQQQHRQSDEGTWRGGGERHSRPASPLILVLAPLDDVSWRVSCGDAMRCHVRVVVLATPRPVYESLEPTETSQHISARRVERPGMRSGFDDKPKVQITSTLVYASGS